jgi:diguanylate cyclase (GGDEF)-like protein
VRLNFFGVATDETRVTSTELPPEPWAAASADELANAAGASDLFVFRKVGESRYAHVGGAGRGAGWAGIVEASGEELLVQAMASKTPLRRSEREPWHVIGPYYATTVAAIPVSDDVFVVFGASDSATEGLSALTDADLTELAEFASETLVEVAPAKRLADELEVLSAVHDLLHAPADTFAEAIQRLVDQATTSLSCDLGFAFVYDDQHVAISDRRGGPQATSAEVFSALATIGERSTFPTCIQRADVDELPEPFRTTDGVLAYYLLELKQPRRGFLLLLHTTAARPRGFTLLCQSLGQKLVEASEPMLTTAVVRDSMRSQLELAEVQARRDPLTGLANRLAWSEALVAATVCAESPTTIAQFDCRGLKQINDTYGHQEGDRALCLVAKVLRESVREGDLAARLGGDEFAVLLCGADEETAASIVGRIERTLESSRRGDEIPIRLSLGTVTTRDHDLETAHSRADALMVEAKRRGREISLPA